jgi:hypothetical protein
MNPALFRPKKAGELWDGTILKEQSKAKRN